MKTRKKEISKVGFHPGHNWSVHVDVAGGVYGANPVGVSLFGGIVQYCARALSANQVKEVIAEMERQIDERGKGNVLPEWRDLLNELKYGEDAGGD